MLQSIPTRTMTDKFLRFMARHKLDGTDVELQRKLHDGVCDLKSLGMAAGDKSVSFANARIAALIRKGMVRTERSRMPGTRKLVIRSLTSLGRRAL